MILLHQWCNYVCGFYNKYNLLYDLIMTDLLFRGIGWIRDSSDYPEHNKYFTFIHWQKTALVPEAEVVESICWLSSAHLLNPLWQHD